MSGVGTQPVIYCQKLKTNGPGVHELTLVIRNTCRTMNCTKFGLLIGDFAASSSLKSRNKM